MIDLNQIRADPQGVTAALRKRLADVEFTELLQWDDLRRSHIVEADNLRARRNEVSGQIPQLKRRGEPVQELIDEMRQVGQRIKQVENERTDLDQRIRTFLEVLPNVPDPDVPGGGKENNRVLRTWGDKPQFAFAAEDHLAIASRLNLIDYERGVKVAGSGFWVYRGAGALLELALVNHFIARAVAAGYEFMLLPHIVNWECGYISGQFPKFGHDVYRVAGEEEEPPDNQTRGGQVLIPTSETALSALHRDEILDAASTAAPVLRLYSLLPPGGGQLPHPRPRHHSRPSVPQGGAVPVRGTGAIAGGAGCPGRAQPRRWCGNWDCTHRTSQLAANDCSAAAAKTYDVEVWIPSLGSYEEVSSASNTRDYQARRGRTRVRRSSGTTLVHTLNASGLATSRLLPALLETNQRPDGSIAIPKVLHPYTRLHHHRRLAQALAVDGERRRGRWWRAHFGAKVASTTARRRLRSDHSHNPSSALEAGDGLACGGYAAR